MKVKLQSQKDKSLGNLSFQPVKWQRYDDFVNGLRRVNLLQSQLYATCASFVYSQTATPYFIYANNNLIGAFILYEASLLRKMIHAVILDRGPIWRFEDYSPSLNADFWASFDKAFPSRFGRKRRIMPELEDTAHARQTMEDLGYKRYDRDGYQTLWLDLTNDEASLRENMHGKWRNCLRKAEKSELELSWSNRFDEAALLLARHVQEQKDKNYHGPSLKMLSMLSRQADKQDSLLSGFATLDNVVVSGIIFYMHNNSATYQVGWNTPKARNVNANYLLLWQGLLKLQSKGIKDLDLGGVNDADAAGVKRFKSGIGGELVHYIGQYS